MSSTQDLLRAVAAAGVKSKVLEAFALVDRARFVPASRIREAYRDRPVSTLHSQTTSQPSLIGKMVEALQLTGDEKVLEVGTGFGYQTAILSKLARTVYSIERYTDMADAARANLSAQGVENAQVFAGDGIQGLVDQAPFGAIIVSAAYPTMPNALVEQLSDGGRLVMPVAHTHGDLVSRFTKKGETMDDGTFIAFARFVKLLPND